MGKDARAELEQKLKAFVGVPIGPAWVSPDGVNEAMIRHYCAVVGDENPVYHDEQAARPSVHGGVVAPPPMMEVWVMPPYIPPWVAGQRPPDASPPDRQVELHELFDSYGYTGVVGTNQEQRYTRYLRPGERIEATITIAAISEEKATPLGPGYFITTHYDFRDANGDEVGTLDFRVMKFKPAAAAVTQRAATDGTPAAPRRLRPPMAHDNAWWWDGINDGKLLIQKCSRCGVLRHPPRPMCGKCQSVDWATVESAGEGTVYSFTVLHHPKLPGYEYPLICALIALSEGTRIVSNLIGCGPDDVRIGMPVKLSIEHADEELQLPFFRPA